MVTLLLDGKIVRDHIKAKLTEEVRSFSSKPKLLIIQVGERSESVAYITQKKKFGTDIGVSVEHMMLALGISQASLLSQIREANDDRGIHGIIVQLPLPSHIDTARVLEEISPNKDVDGLHSANMKLLLEGKGEKYVPATAKGCLRCLLTIIFLGRSESCGARAVTSVGKLIALSCSMLAQQSPFAIVRVLMLKRSRKRATRGGGHRPSARYQQKLFFKRSVVIDVELIRLSDKNLMMSCQPEKLSAMSILSR